MSYDDFIYCLGSSKLYYIVPAMSPFGLHFSICLFIASPRGGYEVITDAVCKYLGVIDRINADVEANIITVHDKTLLDFKRLIDARAKDLGIKNVIDVEGNTCDIIGGNVE